MTEESTDWQAAAFKLRDQALAHDDQAQETAIRGWALKARAKRAGPRSILWSVIATLAGGGEPARQDKAALDGILELFGAAEMFRKRLFDVTNEDGSKALSCGWVESVEPPPPDPKTGRNESCPCGSGKKFKKCCLGRARG